MSECGLVKTVERTLCGLVLALSAVLLSACNTSPSRHVDRKAAEESVDNVVKTAATYFNNRDYENIEKLFDERSVYITTTNNQMKLQVQNLPGIIVPELKFTPSERTILALAYAMNGKYDDARTQFTNLLEDFKKDPSGTIKDIDKLEDFFAGKEYLDAERKASGTTLFYSEMNAVVGFLKLGRKEYAGARSYFRLAISHFPESTIQEYRDAFVKLMINECKEGKNEKKITEYALIIGTLYSAKGKETN